MPAYDTRHDAGFIEDSLMHHVIGGLEKKRIHTKEALSVNFYVLPPFDLLIFLSFDTPVLFPDRLC